MSTPALIICCGVSGSGKTSMARYLADQLDLAYVEADDFHTPANKAHMAAGKPLTDEMREPWMQALCAHLREQLQAGRQVVLAHSALRRAHRERLRGLGAPTLFLLLEGSFELIQKRLETREGHYMKSDLLQSQFEAQEPPEAETDFLRMDISKAIPELALESQTKVRDFLRTVGGTVPESGSAHP